MATAAATTTSTAASTSVDAKLLASKSRLASSEETFLALLTTQLKNQDPLSPLDSNAFTQQLVQMTGVEQQLLTNQLLQSMVSQSAGTMTNAVNYIGKSITAEYDQVTLADGTASWNYTLPANTSEAVISIKNSLNQTVWTGSTADLASGTHTFNWNGKTTDGRQLNNGGTYTMIIAAKDAAAGEVTVPITVTGKVTAIETVNGETQALIGRTRIPITKISGVTG